jgi:CheY-like chemotaxis protein
MPETILIVDDWDDDAELLRLTLDEIGLVNPIQIVHSAAEAIAYLQGDFPYSDRGKFPLPKIILLDLNMPRMDGFDFLKWLSAKARLADFMVIVVSGVDDWVSMRRAYELGAASFLTKPCRRLDLEHLIEWFPRYWTRPTPPPPPPLS